MGQIIVISSGKGGTGKTSFTAAVGTALALRKQKVLCLDYDVCLRNLDISLGMTDMPLMDFSDVLSKRCTLDEAIVRHPKVQSLYLLTAPVYASKAEISMEGMRTLLAEIKKKFDFCLIDAPAGIGSGFYYATRAVDRAIVVSTTDLSSLRDAQRAVQELSHLKDSKVHLVVNRVDKAQLKKMHRNIDDAMDIAGLPLLGIVPEDPDIPKCANSNTAFLLTYNEKASFAYQNIARRLLGEQVPLGKF